MPSIYKKRRIPTWVIWLMIAVHYWWLVLLVIVAGAVAWWLA